MSLHLNKSNLIKFFVVSNLQHIHLFFLFLSLIFLTPVSQAQTIDDGQKNNQIKIFLLGEIHDNSHSHDLRYEFFQSLITDVPNAIVAMEQFDSSNQASLDLALNNCGEAECVIQKAGTVGWDWNFYKPYVQLALDKKVSLIAANLSNEDVRKVMTNGFLAIYSQADITNYKLNEIGSTLVEKQTKSIKEGHCNMLPPVAVGPMVKGQIARDVWMADIINKTQSRLIILLAGNGHVRKDAGIYQWLTARKKLQTQVHGFVEQVDSRDSDWFDYVHLAQTIEREDPCKAFETHRLAK